MNASASLIFVKFFLGTSKSSGKAFQMLELSDGLKSKSFFTQFDEDLTKFTEKLERGDRVIVELNIDIFDERNQIKIVDIQHE